MDNFSKKKKATEIVKKPQIKKNNNNGIPAYFWEVSLIAEKNIILLCNNLSSGSFMKLGYNCQKLKK